LITNYRPSALKRLKIDYDSVKHTNIIYCSVVSFPEEDRPAYDTTILASSGLMDMTGDPKGEPSKFATSIADVTTGLMAVIYVLGAVVKGDRPVNITMPMLHVLHYLTLEDAYVSLNLGTSPTRSGSALRYLVPYQAFKTRDGYLYLTVFTDQQYERLCDLLKRDDLKVYSTLELRQKNRESIVSELERTSSKESRDHWISLLKDEVPCSPVLSLRESLQRWGKVAEIVGIKYIDLPVKSWRIQLPTPRLGEHTEQILSELGYEEGEIHELRLKGVIR